MNHGLLFRPTEVGEPGAFHSDFTEEGGGCLCAVRTSRPVSDGVRVGGEDCGVKAGGCEGQFGEEVGQVCNVGDREGVGAAG